MPAYADVDDLEARWRQLTPEEAARAAVLLEDASVILRAEVPGLDERIVDGIIDPAIPLQIVAGMVKRAMQGPDGMEGVRSYNTQAGPFGEGVTFANPSGVLYIDRHDRQLLGFGRQRAFTVSTVPPREVPDVPIP